MLVDGTVRRTMRPWSPAVHHLLKHLEAVGFAGAPRFLGIDDYGREILSYLAGQTIGDSRPWPSWPHSDAALDDIGAWVRVYHCAVADYTPPSGALWREGAAWQPGMVVAHGDAAPYNAVWNSRGLVGLIDWDMAGPTLPEQDLAWIVFSWTPLHARQLVTEEGFTNFAQRRERAERVLRAYGWDGSVADILRLIAGRLESQIKMMRRVAAQGDETYRTMLDRGVDRQLESALDDLASLQS